MFFLSVLLTKKLHTWKRMDDHWGQNVNDEHTPALQIKPNGWHSQRWYSVHLQIDWNDQLRLNRSGFELLANIAPCTALLCPTLTSYQGRLRLQINSRAHTPGFHLANGRPITLKSKSPWENDCGLYGCDHHYAMGAGRYLPDNRHDEEQQLILRNSPMKSLSSLGEKNCTKPLLG